MVTSCGSIGLWIWVVAAFSMVPSYGMRFLGCSQRSPFMGFQQYSSPQRRRRLWPELVGGADGPHLWDCVVLLYRQRSPPMGWVAWRKCKRTPDMGRGPGMGQPGSPKGHHLWGGPRARSTKGPQIWDADPGWGGRGFPKCEGVQDFV